MTSHLLLTLQGSRHHFRAIQIEFKEIFFSMFHEAEPGLLVQQRKHSNKLSRLYLGSRERPQ